jgi:predicted PurR-regulated permease PerM
MRRFVVGEFISMTIVGVATYIGLVALGVPFPFLLAVIAFALELLPILGPWLSAVPAIALALSESVELAIAVAVFYLVLQQVESNVILPMVQRHQTGMPALVVLSAVLLGGAAMGILGALVALPLAVILHTVAMEVVIPWRQARLASGAPDA